MLALVEDINRCAEKCASCAGSLVADGGTVEFSDFDPIVNEVDRALVAIRTLDYEVFEKACGQAYRERRESHREGGVVHAFTALRNVATHSAAVVDPDVHRAVGLSEPGTFLIFPRWRDRSDLPTDAFVQQSGKDSKARIRAYDAAVAGRLLLDTLIDAFAFFDSCDDRLAARDNEGKLIGFPLPPLPVAFGYYRLGPEWPTHEQAGANTIQRATEAVPVGDRRTVVGTVHDGRVICGWTEVDSIYRVGFTETAHQVTRDIERGFIYTTSAEVPIVADGEFLRTATGVALTAAVPDVTYSPESWESRWATVTRHRDLYVKQRRAM